MTEPERLGIRLVLKPPYFIDLYWKQGDPHIVLTVREAALLGWHERHISVNVPLNGWDIIAEFVAAVREHVELDKNHDVGQMTVEREFPS